MFIRLGRVRTELISLYACHYSFNNVILFQSILSNSDPTLTSKLVTVGAKSLTVHPKFVVGTYDYNIALVELQKPVTFTSTIKPACLNRDKRNSRTEMVHVGWGNGYFNGSGLLLRITNISNKP